MKSVFSNAIKCETDRLLESTKKKARPRKVDLYEIFCAILYLLKNACAWRNLPHDFPNWKLVNYYY
ncbi:MAG: transposase, partial [Synergistaceae bacterium]|nr:transposase [Synergistaceae bacterium]